jgi:hypothetical protein
MENSGILSRFAMRFTANSDHVGARAPHLARLKQLPRIYADLDLTAQGDASEPHLDSGVLNFPEGHDVAPADKPAKAAGTSR